MEGINFLQLGAQQGWQCPVCNRVLSPYVQECPCYKEKGQWAVTTTHVDSTTLRNEE